MNHRISLTLAVMGTALWAVGVSFLTGSAEELLGGAIVMLIGTTFLAVGMSRW